MNKLKVCFIGVGSIAKRHIKNLIDICTEKKIGLTVDALRRNKSYVENASYDINKIYHSVEELPNDYDVIFITNPTDFHIETLKIVHDKGKHFFIEKPVTSYSKLESIYDIQYRSDSVYYVACPLRYSSVVQYIVDNINLDEVICARSISSSYLPEWREGVDYRDTYSAHKELGGGVSIDLIHEWDYLQYLFGKPEKIVFMQGKKSNLEINSEDYACYIAEYKDKIVELHLDYFGRKSIREIMLFMENDVLVGDFINSKITFLKSGKIINFFEDRNVFQKRELSFFLNLLINNNNKNYIYEAYNTTYYTQGIIK